MKSTPSTSLHRNNHRSARRSFLLMLGLLAGLAGHGFAENPWNSSLGWSSSGADRGVSSEGWASWDSTVGGTFDNPFSSHHFTRSVTQSEERFSPAPTAVRNPEIDPVMLKAASIAEHRALDRGILRCWRYVKEALVAAGSVSSYPQTAYARDAGRELVENYGFVRLSVRNAASAPIGSVLVYGGPGAGHVELRTPHGFASDFRARRPANLPFIGAYTRLAGHHRSDTAQATVAMTTGS